MSKLKFYTGYWAYVTIVIIIAFGNTGCSGHMAVMKNIVTGDVKTCQVTGAEMMASPFSARSTQTNCVNALKKAGYMEVVQ